LARWVVVRHIDLVVPAVLDEIDRLTTGAVLAAVVPPVLEMLGRDMEIDRPAFHPDRRWRDQDRFRVDKYRWRSVADFDAAV
jgi:hypothetical protein